MSTLQRATLDSTEPAAGARLLLVGAGDEAVVLPEDIAALRLRALAARFTGSDIATSTADDGDTLDDADTEFEPVSLARIVALGRTQTPDTPGDALITPHAVAAAVESTPVVMVPATDVHVATSDPPGPAVLLRAEPLHPAHEEPHRDALAPLIEDEPSDLLRFADAPGDADADSEVSIVTAPTADEPLMLADQSGSDIRLIDLIRRQQTLLEQLNRFPPPYDTTENDATGDLSATSVPALSVVDQLAPPASPASPAADIERDAPPPLPAPASITLPPPTLKPLPARERKEEPDEAELPQQSPMIIQRARAERIGRRIGPAVAAPPSALPAFLVGLAAAVAIAGVMLAVL